MKKYGKLNLLALLLALLMACSFMSMVSCNKNETPAASTPEATTPEVTTTAAPEPEPDPDPIVTVVNGTFEDGTTSVVLEEETSLTMNAELAPMGFVFSHWENSAGETVGEETTLTLTVDAAETYKAYYEVEFGELNSQVILDKAEDWMQGSYDGKFQTFQNGNTTRISSAEPIFLKAGSVLSISLPTVQCPVNAGDCPELEGTGDCKLMAAVIVLNAPTGTSTNVWYNDYTVKNSKWGTIYTATADTYVTIMLKWDKHGGLTNSFLVGSDVQMNTVVTVTAPSEDKFVGYHWISELDDTIATIEANRETIGEGVSEFFYITDSHWPDNAGYSPALVNYIAEQIDAYHVVFGGDIITRYNPVKQDAIDGEINAFYNALEKYTKVGEKLKIMTTLGNHDRNGSSNQPDKNGRLTEQEAYDLYMKRMEGWGVTVPGDANKSYYDDTVNKVRYIQFYFAGSQYGMIEDGYVDEAMAWAEEQILALDEDWTVVLFTHGVFCGAEGSDTEYTPKDKEVIARMLALQGEARAEIACWITGHIHYDRFEVLGDAAGNKLLLMSLSTDTFSYSTKMTAGTTTEQGVNFIQIDVKNEQIYLTRAGVGSNKVFGFGSKNGDVTLSFDSTPDEPDPEVIVNVVNGTLEGGKTSVSITEGSSLTLQAISAPKGYTFSHWENSKGEKVAETATAEVTVGDEETYKAYFKVVIGTSIGSYWETEVNDAIAKIEANRTAIGEGVSEFFYLTDSHWPDNAGYSPALINYVAEQVDAYHVVFGGDIIRRYNAVKQNAIDDEINGFYNALEKYTKTGEKLKIMSTLGNHDRNGSSNQPDKNGRLTEQEAYDLYMKRMEGWGVTVQGDSNKSYYDDTVNKVRYIQFYFAGSQYGMIEDGYVDAAMAWAEQKILELDESWTVVLFTHGVFCGAEGSDTEYTPKDREVIARMLDLQGKADAEIACWITGHIHYDRFEVLGDDNGNKLLLMSLCTDAYSHSNKMTNGTNTEQTISFIQVDVENEQIYLTRIGMGEDRVFGFGSKNGDVTELFIKQVSIRVQNGTTSAGKSYATVDPGTEVTFTANTITGYTFSHWVNANGETVGTTKTMTVTAGRDTVYYKAVYTDTDPSNDKTPAANQIATDIANDWQQGSYDGDFLGWKESLLGTRVTFAEPYLLKKGETITVTYPKIVESLDACYTPNKPCADGCKLSAAIVTLKKIEGSDTGDLFTDYEVVSYSWKLNGTGTYTATEDTYVVVMFKMKDHGGYPFNLSFPEMQDVVITVTPAA